MQTGGECSLSNQTISYFTCRYFGNSNETTQIPDKPTTKQKAPATNVIMIRYELFKIFHTSEYDPCTILNSLKFSIPLSLTHVQF